MRYVLRKIGALFVTLFLISLFSFLAFQVISGDPTAKILGAEATPERVAELREALGLNAPIMERYINWLANFVRGDFGRSYSYSMPVSEMVLDKIPVTAALSAMAFLIVIAVSIPLGVILARYEGRALDKAAVVVNQLFMTIPSFFFGIVFTYIFGLILHLFTPGSYISYHDNLLGFFSCLFFPALAIAVPKSAMTVKLLRNNIMGEMNKDYVRTAYSWGNSRRSVLRNHVLRNAILPVISWLSITLSEIVAGSIIIERVFSIPGIGRLLISSVANRDYPIVQAIVVIIAFFVVVVSAVTDIVNQWVDPRIRLN